MSKLEGSVEGILEASRKEELNLETVSRNVVKMSLKKRLVSLPHYLSGQFYYLLSMSPIC